jgi:hypothetical protein
LTEGRYDNAQQPPLAVDTMSDEQSSLLVSCCKSAAHVVLGAALTAVVVRVGEKMTFLDWLPIVGGRGSTYAAASLLFAVLP